MALTQVDTRSLSTQGGLRSVITRPQAGAASALLALAGAAWVVSGVRMAGMDGGPGSYPTALGLYTSTWVVMMAAMMLPSIVPTVWKYDQSATDRRAWLTAGVRAGAFACGYLAVWTAAGLLAYGLLRAAGSLDGELFAWHREGRYLAAGVLAAAAGYELTPFKRASLRRCRAPLTARADSHRATVEPVRIGVESGARCLGCCWALMAALFALGEMSLTWMTVIAAVIAVQKLAPYRRLTSSGVAIILAALAVGLAAAPTHVPALTIPGSPAAMHEMGMSTRGAHARNQPAMGMMGSKQHGTHQSG